MADKKTAWGRPKCDLCKKEIGAPDEALVSLTIGSGYFHFECYKTALNRGKKAAGPLAFLLGTRSVAASGAVFSSWKKMEGVASEGDYLHAQNHLGIKGLNMLMGGVGAFLLGLYLGLTGGFGAAQAFFIAIGTVLFLAALRFEIRLRKHRKLLEKE